MGNGYRYADMFTADGTFGVSSEWGKGGEDLVSRARSARRRRGRRPGTLPTRVGETELPPHHQSGGSRPRATGASAISTLLTITNDTNDRGDVVHWEGGYEDTFEKTAQGWRFKMAGCTSGPR